MVRNLTGRQTKLAAPETGNVGIRGVGADRHAALPGGANGVTHRHDVAGVKSARDIRRRDEIQQRLVFSETRFAESFPEVGVEIYRYLQAARRYLLLDFFPAFSGLASITAQA